LSKNLMSIDIMEDLTSDLKMKVRKDAVVPPKSANALFFRKKLFVGWRKLCVRRLATHDVLNTWHQMACERILTSAFNFWQCEAVQTRMDNQKSLSKAGEVEYRVKMKAFMGWTLITSTYSQESHWQELMNEAKGGLDYQRNDWEDMVVSLENELQTLRAQAKVCKFCTHLRNSRA